MPIPNTPNLWEKVSRELIMEIEKSKNCPDYKPVTFPSMHHTPLIIDYADPIRFRINNEEEEV